MRPPTLCTPKAQRVPLTSVPSPCLQVGIPRGHGQGFVLECPQPGHCHPLPPLSLRRPARQAVVAVGSQAQAGLETRHDELFMSGGREVAINNTSALSHSVCVYLWINISFTRNMRRCLLINKNWKMFHWVALNETPSLHPKNSVYPARAQRF